MDQSGLRLKDKGLARNETGLGQFSKCCQKNAGQPNSSSFRRVEPKILSDIQTGKSPKFKLGDFTFISYTDLNIQRISIAIVKPKNIIS